FTEMEDTVVDQLCKASAQGNLAAVKRLLQNGVDVNGLNTFNRTALQVVKTGHTALVLELLLAGAEPNVADPACDLTVLHDASRDGFAASVQLLLQHGADANMADRRGNLPLHLAAEEGHPEVVRLLMEHTENPQSRNKQGATALQLAGRRGRVDTVRYLLERLSPR
uniref:Cyclin-dependent kinase inhibitor 2C (p18, inhibits CDK4) n=1 Tax=Tetraodon nigroviridis TaxID=99883 RepID=H3DDG5_TETNG